MTERSDVGKFLSTSIHEVLGGEDIIIEVARDLIKEEFKSRIKEVLDEDPELKDEFKKAVEQYYKAKINESIAAFRVVKASAYLGLKLSPKDVQKDLKEELEREIVKIIDKTI